MPNIVRSQALLCCCHLVKRLCFFIGRWFCLHKMASASNPKRQIFIKTGVVKRLGKEKVMYEKEVVDQQQKIDKMKAEGKDEHDIKKQIEVLEESKMMIPDCKRRLKNAHQDLKNLLAQTEAELADTEEYKAGQKIIQDTVLED